MAPPLSTAQRAVPPIGALALIAGFGVAQVTGNRAAGGAVLVVAAVWCVWTWRTAPGLGRAALAVAVFGIAFAGSHPLGRLIGPWPSVILVAAASGLIAWWLGFSRR